MSVHVPAGATGAVGSGGDAPIIVVDGDTVYNFWRFSRTSDTTATAQSYGEASVSTGTGWGTLQTPTAANNWQSSLGAGVGAAGNSELGGLLVQAQTDTGTIDHALQLAVAGTQLKPGYVSPAIATDGTSSGGIVQEGQLLAIPKGTPMPSGLSPLGQEVFRALQQYGAYVTEMGGDQTVLRAQQNAYDATTISALNTDLNKLLPMLNAVSGGSPTTTPTTPTTPINVAPTVTQASALPGTGVEHVGDTITMTLGFSEAVTVTGTPTLSLNDGAKATYVSGTGTNALTFKTTVASTDTNTSALAITGVNLPSGSSIKDAGGLAADLSGAVKTFAGLQISTASPTTPTTPTPSVTTPVLSVAHNSLWVAGRGGTVDLGTTVTTTDTNDQVTLNIKGLPRYETITDNLDGQTFRGSDITLTSAQVDSGLTLTSNYRGGGQPVANLTLTARAKDPITGAVTSAAPQTITVTDPRPATAATTTSQQTSTVTTPQPTSVTTATSPQTTPVTDPSPSTGTNTGWWGEHRDLISGGGTTTPPDGQGYASWGQHRGSIASDGTPATGTSTWLAGQGSALLSEIRDLIANRGVATSASPITVTDTPHATGTTTASLASQSFALLNQYLAGSTGRVEPGQIVAAVSNGNAWAQGSSFLTKPQH
ncbi:hypothetical protein [Bradyrhizobium sp. USDA 4486]